MSRGAKPLERGSKGLSPGTGLQRRTPLTPGKGLSASTPADRERPPTSMLHRKTPLTSKSSTERTNTPSADLLRGASLSPGSKGLSSGSGGLSNTGALARTPKRRAVEDAPAAPPKRIPQQSKKRQAELPERRRIVAAVFAIEPMCLAPGCYAEARDGHERKTRARGGSTTCPFNVVSSCRAHNEALTEEPAWGYESGLLLHSWDPDPTEPLPWLSEDQKAALWRVKEEGWYPKTTSEVQLWYRTRKAA